ncbi:MAG: flagellar M-ring protein FliF, partial [Oscillospiraceae bacterium]|nr:flagellar M-ring protein FliF [Oscillospiraceae bacterium]
MKEKLNKVLSTFTEFWKAQDKKRKIIYISALAGVFAVAVIITIVLNIKHYVVLYEGLDAKEASEIVTEIQNLGVDATLSSDGKISVPKEQENNLRMQLATKGYPKSSLSYDVWNNNVDMFTTDYEKREQARMQLQERLQGTI